MATIMLVGHHHIYSPHFADPCVADAHEVLQDGDIEIVFEEDDDDDEDQDEEMEEEQGATTAPAGGQTEAEITALRNRSMSTTTPIQYMDDAI